MTYKENLGNKTQVMLTIVKMDRSLVEMLEIMGICKPRMYLMICMVVLMKNIIPLEIQSWIIQSIEKSTYGYENIYGYGTQLQFDSKKNRNSEDAGQKLKRKTRLPRCKTCPECKAPDCGTCRMCLDMVRFGGPGKLRKSCIQKGKCTGQGNASNGLKTSSPELKEHSPKQSQYLLSSFIGSNSNLVKRSNPVEGNAVPGHSEEHLNKNTSLGKLMDYVKTHEVSNGGSDKPDVPEENEPDRRELENALGSIGAEPNNDWINNSG